MPEIFIITESASSSSHSWQAPSIATEMKQAILDADALNNRVTILPTTELDSLKEKLPPDLSTNIICPLTLEIPNWLTAPNQAVYRVCADAHGLRQRVGEWNYQVGEGKNWLPIVWTAKGPLYGEAIAQIGETVEQRYQQPLHLVDSQRQTLYRLGKMLLATLQAFPGVYLMQFGIENHEIWFDRLIPFPDAPALASLGVQTPNLFQCHWLCLTKQPIRDLVVSKPFK